MTDPPPRRHRDRRRLAGASRGRSAHTGDRPVPQRPPLPRRSAHPTAAGAARPRGGRRRGRSGRPRRRVGGRRRPRRHLPRRRLRHMRTLQQGEPFVCSNPNATRRPHGERARLLTADGRSIGTMANIGSFSDRMLVDERALVRVPASMPPPSPRSRLRGRHWPRVRVQRRSRARHRHGGRHRLRRSRLERHPGRTHRWCVADRRRRRVAVEARARAEARRNRHRRCLAGRARRDRPRLRAKASTTRSR